MEIQILFRVKRVYVIYVSRRGKDFISKSGRIKILKGDWAGVWPQIKVEAGQDLELLEHSTRRNLDSG